MNPDILVRSLIASYLRDRGYKVLEGVSAGSGQKIDVVFSEVRLRRKVNRLGLARLVREQYPDVDVMSTLS